MAIRIKNTTDLEKCTLDVEYSDEAIFIWFKGGDTFIMLDLKEADELLAGLTASLQEADQARMAGKDGSV